MHSCVVKYCSLLLSLLSFCLFCVLFMDLRGPIQIKNEWMNEWIISPFRCLVWWKSVWDELSLDVLLAPTDTCLDKTTNIVSAVSDPVLLGQWYCDWCDGGFQRLGRQAVSAAPPTKSHSNIASCSRTCQVEMRIMLSLSNVSNPISNVWMM